MFTPFSPAGEKSSSSTLLLLQKIDGFTDRRLAEFQLRNDDALELPADALSTGLGRGILDIDLDRGVEAPDGARPGHVRPGDGVGAGLVIGGDAVVAQGAVDFFLEAARGDVRGIDIEDLLAALRGEAETAGIVEALGSMNHCFTCSTFARNFGPIVLL